MASEPKQIRTDFHRSDEAEARLRRRYRAERRFRAYCATAVIIALVILVWLVSTVVGAGYTAFYTHEIELEVHLDEKLIDPRGTGDPAVIRSADYKPVILEAIIDRFPSITEDLRAIDRRIEENRTIERQRTEDLRRLEAEQKELDQEILGIVRRPQAIDILKDYVLDDIERIGEVARLTVPASDAAASYVKNGRADRGALTERQSRILDELAAVDSITVGEDGAVTLNAIVELRRDLLDPDEEYDEDIIEEEADWNSVLARGLAGYSIPDADLYFSKERQRELAEQARRAAQRQQGTLRREKVEIENEAVNLVSESGAADTLRTFAYENPSALGTTRTFVFATSGNIDQALKGYIRRDLPEELRKVSNRQFAWAEELKETGALRAAFNTGFFLNPDSQEAELAGIASAVMGSIFAILVTFAISFPIGIAAATYLEEFAPKNWFTTTIEVNINNLAAVPSIIFGLLGLAVFLNFMGLPRSVPLVGGMVLALLTLPTIIIATRAALKSVPPSIREGALAVGASPVQTVFHHVLPLAMPGILTGTILGLARALGESAPLLMIGMIAFVTQIPSGILEPAPALPVQIFMWSDRPERAFQEKTSGAIIVFLAFLFLMNLLAVILRNRFERRW